MNMKLVSAAVVLASFAAPAMAWEGQVVACYDSVWVPDQYQTSKVLHSKARTAWEHRGKQLVEVYYAPVYIEKRTLARKGHYLKRKAACKH
jgi:hypothetical protein